jgi:retron-type reverse transcriptase
MSAAATLAGAAPDVVPGWHAINWHKVWRNVRRLQARIVKAIQEGRWNKVRSLVYLLTHSFSGRAAAILRVTTNAGASTPGVDGEVWNTPELKAAAFNRLRRHGYQPQPLRRIYIPKSSDPSKLRPLGIPTLTDRAMQALYLLGLDPIEETTADANSYGFRSQRCCADALDQCHKILRKNHSATWILEGDIKACFDRIGLELSHEKTSITHVDDGFDFLGQNVRRYGTKILLKPSRKNVKAFLAKIDEVIQHQGGYLSAGQLIERLNPKIRGWALYHQQASSARTFARVDDVIFKKLWRWARRRHRGKSAAWVKRTYFTGRGDNPWRFRGTVRDADGGFHTVFLVRAKDTPIRRHVKVRGTANPYDPAWELYFEERLAHQMANSLTGRGTARYLWLEQNGRCPVCGQPLTLEEGWQVHHLLWRAHGGDDTIDNRVLLHPNCHRQAHSEGLVVEKFASREGRS